MPVRRWESTEGVGNGWDRANREMRESENEDEDEEGVKAGCRKAAHGRLDLCVLRFTPKNVSENSVCVSSSSSKFPAKPRTKDEGRGRARVNHTFFRHALSVLRRYVPGLLLSNSST
jgi:hypothetical protein